MDFITGIERDWFARPFGQAGWDGIHGLGHTVRVRTHADAIARGLELDERERAAIDAAAMWHDIGRTHDNIDYYHGAKSAGKVVAFGLERGLEPSVAEMALYAVTHHSGSERHAESAATHLRAPESALRVLRVLKDADALDRVRIHDLDVTYLRFPFSHTRVSAAQDLLREYDPPRTG